MLFFFRFFRLLLFKGRKSLTVKNRIINLIQFEVKYKKVKERQKLKFQKRKRWYKDINPTRGTKKGERRKK